MQQFVNIPTTEWRDLTNRLYNIENMLKEVTVNNSKSIWLTKLEAKKLLNIKSDKTLYTLRKNGTISFNTSNPRNLLYSRKSIENYLKEKSSTL